MSRFLRLSTVPSASGTAATARRSRGRSRSAVVDLVPIGTDPLDDDDDDDDDGSDSDPLAQRHVVRPSPTPSPPNSPGRLLAQFYLDRPPTQSPSPSLDEPLPVDDLFIPPSYDLTQQQSREQDSLLDFPPTPSTVHSSFKRSLAQSPLVLVPSTFTPSEIPPPLPTQDQDQVQQQPDDDPFGFAMVERRMQLTRPFSLTQESTVTVPPPSQRPPSSSFLSSPQSTSTQAQQDDLFIRSHRPTTPLSSLHLTATAAATQDPLDPTLHPPPLTCPFTQHDTPQPASATGSPLPTLTPPPPSSAQPPLPATVSAPPPPNANKENTSTVARAASPTSDNDNDNDDDDDFFTFKPTSRAAQTHSRISSAMHAALHTGGVTVMSAGPSRGDGRRRKAPVARTATTSDGNKRVADDDDQQRVPGLEVKLSPRGKPESKKPAAAAPTTARRARGKKSPLAAAATPGAKEPVQVTRFLGELIGVPTSSPSPPRQSVPAGDGVARTDEQEEESAGPDLDARLPHPIRSTTAAASVTKKRRTATTKNKTQANRAPASASKAESHDPFALPLDPSPPPMSKTKSWRAARGVAGTKKPATTLAAAGAGGARKKRTSAERVAAAGGEQREEEEEAETANASPRKRTRTSQSAAAAPRDSRGVQLDTPSVHKRVTRARRAAAAEVEE